MVSILPFTRNPRRLHVDPAQRPTVALAVVMAAENTCRELDPTNNLLDLCAGCTVIALFDALVILSQRNHFKLRVAARVLGEALLLLSQRSEPLADVREIGENLRKGDFANAA